jgi:hypothetical protein
MFPIQDLKSWLLPGEHGAVSAPYLNMLDVQWEGDQFGKAPLVLNGINRLLSARKAAGVGRSLDIMISWEDHPEMEFRWENGRLVHLPEEIRHLQAIVSPSRSPANLNMSSTITGMQGQHRKSVPAAGKRRSIPTKRMKK